jgi:DNA-binding NarL/FixJ family response regulator
MPRPVPVPIRAAIWRRSRLGQTAAQIAAHLVISERTVETHLANVYVKLGVRSKTELIRRAPELGI